MKLSETLILFIVLIPSLSPAGPSAELQREFANALYSAGDYYGAVNEAMRLQMAPGAPPAPYDLFIAGAYYAGGSYRSAAHHLSAGSAPFSMEENRLISASLFRLGEFENSLLYVSPYDYKTAGASGAMDLFSARAAALASLGRYDGILDEARSAGSFAGESARLADIRKLLAPESRPAVKSPVLSAVLSVFIPGAGQIYSGKAAEGLISFAGVAGLSAAAWALYASGEGSLAAGAGFFSLIFYAGGIYGSYNSALDANVRASDEYRDSIHRLLPEYQPPVNRL